MTNGNEAARQNRRNQETTGPQFKQLDPAIIERIDKGIDTSFATDIRLPDYEEMEAISSSDLLAKDAEIYRDNVERKLSDYKLSEEILDQDMPESFQPVTDDEFNAHFTSIAAAAAVLFRAHGIDIRTVIDKTEDTIDQPVSRFQLYSGPEHMELVSGLIDYYYDCDWPLKSILCGDYEDRYRLTGELPLLQIHEELYLEQSGIRNNIIMESLLRHVGSTNSDDRIRQEVSRLSPEVVDEYQNMRRDGIQPATSGQVFSLLIPAFDEYLDKVSESDRTRFWVKPWSLDRHQRQTLLHKCYRYFGRSGSNEAREITNAHEALRRHILNPAKQSEPYVIVRSQTHLDGTIAAKYDEAFEGLWVTMCTSIVAIGKVEGLEYSLNQGHEAGAEKVTLSAKSSSVVSNISTPPIIKDEEIILRFAEDTCGGLGAGNIDPDKHNIHTGPQVINPRVSTDSEKGVFSSARLVSHPIIVVTTRAEVLEIYIGNDAVELWLEQDPDANSKLLAAHADSDESV